MDSSSVSIDGTSGLKDKESMVDPFLVEALQNSRHRLTILRMELDIQRFLNNADQQHFEFQHFPSSYLRLAAHRVAQHYGMQTMVQDGLDGRGNKIVVRKLAENRYPVVCLSEIPAKHIETDKLEQIKIATRPRPYRANVNEANEAGRAGNFMRSVEVRKEEYDRARARIFSRSRSPDLNDTQSDISMDGKGSCMNKDEIEVSRNSIADSEKYNSVRDIGSTRVAIFRDREKDRSDPDYDRSYRRYARSTPNSVLNLVPYNLPKVEPSFGQYDPTFNQMGHISQTQASLGYAPPTTHLSPFGATGVNQTSGNAAYLQWPSAAMMYAHTYDQFRHAVYPAPFGQQPLSFDYSQNY
ncbi:uncharacterized protein LOC129306250 [Prosopis cineraria]|uniref:uncharacterized protein LOC129306250 n=1 Tax=Prosopis cineraria TaxID=364024 RepID=UPI0024106E12|nr:uncharacterized protein LOC129306250 [Prosopis cineraria]